MPINWTEMIDSITFWKYVFALEIGLPTLYLFLRYYFKKDKQVDAINNRRQQEGITGFPEDTKKETTRRGIDEG